MTGVSVGTAKAELEEFLADWAMRHRGVTYGTQSGCVRFSICIDTHSKARQLSMLNDLFAGLQTKFCGASFVCTISLPSCSVLAVKKSTESAFSLTRTNAADQLAITAVHLTSHSGTLDVYGYNLHGAVTAFKCTQGEEAVEYLLQSAGEMLRTTSLTLFSYIF